MGWNHAKYRAGLIAGLLALSSYGMEGYYKDLFVDGGVGLTSGRVLPAADTLHLNWERISTSSTLLSKQALGGEPADSNGHLLYPDGSPRFRMMYVHGGHAVDHGDSIGPVARQRIITFYNNGGSYSGSCAGAIFATEATGTYEREAFNESYLHIFPGRTHYTQLADSYTDMLLPASSPLLKYGYNFGTEHRVTQVRHNGGNYVIPGDDYYWAPGTEVLATYATPVVGDAVHQDFVGKGSIWAYKTSVNTGRLVLLGSHPEFVTSGDKLHMFAGCLRYALEGTGATRVKAQLELGKTRIMDNNAKPGFEKIGDKQYHHFTVVVPKNTPVLNLSLEGQAGYEFGFCANNGAPAFASVASYKSTMVGATHQLSIPNPAEGTWYIAVELKTAVVSQQLITGQIYTGNIPVLNGISYKVGAAITPAGIVKSHGLGQGDLRLLEGIQGGEHRLEMNILKAGQYEFVLRSLTGQVLATKQEYLPAGKARMSFHLDGAMGGTVVGVLRGPQGVLTGHWTL